MRTTLTSTPFVVNPPANAALNVANPHAVGAYVLRMPKLGRYEKLCIPKGAAKWLTNDGAFKIIPTGLSPPAWPACVKTRGDQRESAEMIFTGLAVIPAPSDYTQAPNGVVTVSGDGIVRALGRVQQTIGCHAFRLYPRAPKRGSSCPQRSMDALRQGKMPIVQTFRDSLVDNSIRSSDESRCLAGLFALLHDHRLREKALRTTVREHQKAQARCQPLLVAEAVINR